MMNRVYTASPAARQSSQRRFRIAVIVASVVVAAVGSVLLTSRHSRENVTTRGVAATLHLPGHPGSVVAAPDALWVALTGQPQNPVGDRPLLLLDLATGTVAQTVHLGGQATHLTHLGDRLIVAVQPVGSDGFGPARLAVFDWLSGRVLFSQRFDGAVDQLVRRGNELWVLEARPGTLLRVDPLTLAPASAPLRLSPGRTLGLASGSGYLWVTATDAGEVLRIDPVKRAITPIHVGGSPIGIVVAGGSVWFADRAGGKVVRLDPHTLRPIGDPVHVGTKPSRLAVAADSLFVTDEEDGTVTRIDVLSAKRVGPPIRVAAPTKETAAADITAAGSAIWVSSYASNTLTRINPKVAGSPRARPVVTSGSRRVRPRGGEVVARIAVPLGGGGLAVGEGAVWAMSDALSTLMRIDPKRNAIVARIRVESEGETPDLPELAVGNGAVWLTHPSRNTVSRIDPRTNAVAATIHVGPKPVGIAVSPGAVWVANIGGPSVSRIDAATNRVVATIRVGPPGACCVERMELIAHRGAVWVGVARLKALVRIDPASNKVTATVKVPYSPCATLAANEAAVWSAGGTCDDVVGRVDPRTNRLAGTLEDEPHPVGLALGFGSVWLAVFGSGSVDRIDPQTGRVVGRLPVGASPVRLGTGLGAVWVYDNTGRVLRIRPAG